MLHYVYIAYFDLIRFKYTSFHQTEVFFNSLLPSWHIIIAYQSYLGELMNTEYEWRSITASLHNIVRDTVFNL